MQIFAGTASQELAVEVAKEVGVEMGGSLIKRFPDGECYTRIMSKVKKGNSVAVVQGISHPQDKNLTELLFLMHGLKEMGAKIICVVPYFGYARQDRAFEDGEVVSSKVVAELIERFADSVLAVNLHKKHILDFFSIPAKELNAAPLIGRYFKTAIGKNSVVISPDKGSFALAKDAARIINCRADHFNKHRIGPGEVKTEQKDIDVENKNVLIIDDIIDSGSTIVEAVKILKQQKPKSINVSCIHGVLTGNAITKICAAGADSLVSTNTIPSQISKISVAKLIAQELKKL